MSNLPFQYLIWKSNKSKFVSEIKRGTGCNFRFCFCLLLERMCRSLAPGRYAAQMQKFCSLFLRDLLFSSGNGKHNRTTTRLPSCFGKKEKVCVCFPTSQSVTPKCTTIVKEGNGKARGKERKNNTSFLLECFTTPQCLKTTKKSHFCQRH